VAAEDLRAGFLPTCRAMARDNTIGRIVFMVTKVIQKVRTARRAVLGMTLNEQNNPTLPQRMSGVLWDTFTGSASYRSVFLRTLHPSFLVRLGYEALVGVIPHTNPLLGYRRPTMRMGEIGRVYPPGEEIFREGEEANCMYVVQSGRIEVVKQTEDGDVRLAELGEGEVFGEMALFGTNTRSATVRPLVESRILTIDRKIFMQKIHEDPSLAFRIMQKMSGRIRTLNDKVALLSSVNDSPD
jgi:hypothetical protein